MILRGIECNVPENFEIYFTVIKYVLGLEYNFPDSIKLIGYQFIENGPKIRSSVLEYTIEAQNKAQEYH